MKQTEVASLCFGLAACIVFLIGIYNKSGHFIILGWGFIVLQWYLLIKHIKEQKPNQVV